MRVCCWEFVTWLHLKLDTGLGHGPEGCCLPVGLLSLLPHHHVEGRWVLVAEDEASIVIISHCIHMKRSLEVHSTESSVTWWQSIISPLLNILLCSVLFMLRQDFLRTLYVLMTDIKFKEEIHLTNSKSWVAIHSLNNFHSLYEKEVMMNFA